MLCSCGVKATAAQLSFLLEVLFMPQILFARDWDKYPVFANTRTSNQSFLEGAALLAEMGVQNHKFMLAQYDRKLIGVDPFDPDLSKEYQDRVAIESQRNFWYHLREVHRVPGSTPDRPIPFKLRRSSIALPWIFFNNIFLILVQPRQTGKSYQVFSVDDWLLNFQLYKANINLLTKDDTLRSASMDTLKKIDEELPPYLRMRKKGDVANSEIFSVPYLGNFYRAYVAQASAKDAQKVGRGHTSGNNRIDEAPYVKNLKISLSAMLASGNAARTMLQEAGKPWGTIMTTTVGDLLEPEGEYTYKLMMNACEFTEKLFDCQSRDHLLDVVRANNKKDPESVGDPVRVYMEFNHRQLGFSDTWLREQMSESVATGADAEKDFLNKWKIGETTSAFENKADRARVIQSRRDPSVELTPGFNYNIRWYTNGELPSVFMANNSVVLGLDASEASGGDDMGLIGTHVKTGQVVMACDVNLTSIPQYSQFVFNFLMKYPKVTLVPERKSTAVTIIDYLLDMFLNEGINPLSRIYNSVVQDATSHPDLVRMLLKPMPDYDLMQVHKKKFGFTTSGGSGATSRKMLYEVTWRSAVSTTSEGVRDKKLIDQLLGLVKDQNGRIDHRQGSHDDLVVAWLLNHWFLKMGKHLHHYGIDYQEVLSQNQQTTMAITPAQAVEKRKNTMLSNELNMRLDIYRKERNPYMRSRLETDIKRLFSMLPKELRLASSYDELMSRLNEEKRLSRM